MIPCYNRFMEISVMPPGKFYLKQIQIVDNLQKA